MTTSGRQLTPSGARRLGDEYQDVVALEALIDWLEHEDRYHWIKVEADDAGHLDDLVMLTSDGQVICRQVKYSNHPDAEDDPYTWDDLLTKKTPNSKSLLEKWASSITKAETIGGLREVAVVSNRCAAPELEQAIAKDGTRKIDFDNIASNTTKQEIITQLGDEALARAFFSKFQFKLNEPSLIELESGLKRRFEKVGGTEAGWHSLKGVLSEWAYYRNEPAPRGEITLADVKRAAKWDQTTGALSSIPLSVRPLVTLPLIGRHGDLEWLTTTSGDLVLVGAPGCGKTFLLREYTRGGRAYFLVDYDREHIITAIRALRPSTIIVDDAHIHTDTLAILRYVRNEISIDFSIIASCWPGERSNVVQALGLPQSQCRELPLLTRDEIAEIVYASGLLGSNDLVQEIVNQAEGRPGLAVTLALLCLGGDVQKVALGDALSESVYTIFEPLIGTQAMELLAAFAVGGETGMAMETAAKLLEMTTVQVRRAVTNLAAGGVITEAGDDRLSVSPMALRCAVVKDVFYAGPFSLSIDPYLVAAPDPWQVAQTLIGVRRRGGAVPDSTLLTFLKSLKDIDLWRAYAYLGAEECLLILQEYPDLASSISDAALEYVPESVLPLLLETAWTDARPLNSSPDHPIRRIEDWISSFVPNTIARRHALVNAVGDWLSNGGDSLTASRALTIALNPGLEEIAARPGSGNSFSINKALLVEQDMRDMGRVWRAVGDMIGRLAEIDWNALISAVEMWANTGRYGISYKQPVVFSLMKNQAGTMVRDLMFLGKDHPGVLVRLREIGLLLGMDSFSFTDENYIILFPYTRHLDWVHDESVQKEAVENMVPAWVSLTPNEVATLLAKYEYEARLAGQKWPRWSPYLCEMIAMQVQSPSEWAHIFLQSEVPADLTIAFVKRAFDINDGDWEELLSRCLKLDSIVDSAISLILGIAQIPSSLAQKLWPLLEGRENVVDLLCLRNQVSEATLKELLNHTQNSVRAAAAIGMWCSEPRGSVPDTLLSSWRSTILDTTLINDESQYWLGEILKRDHTLAREWIETRLAEDPDYFNIEYELESVFAAIEDADRIYLLSRLRDGAGTHSMVVSLVGRSVEAFRMLLSIDQLKEYHLAPLSQVETRPDEQPNKIQFRHAVVWNDMALIALDAGYTPLVVAQALMPLSWTWVGNQSSMWQDWIDGFLSIASHQDERVREVSRIGIDIANSYRDNALANEHNEDVYGY